MKPHLLHTTVLVTCVSALACSEPDFEPYNELEGLRIVAVRAEPPDLLAGETAEIDALVYSASGAAVSLDWSMCPWPSDPNDGYACPVDAALWKAASQDAGFAAPPLELTLDSRAPSLSVPSDVDAVRRLCEALTMRVGSAATLPPDCEREWHWTIRLRASSQKQSVDAVKDVRVLLDDGAIPNANPRIERFVVRSQAGTLQQPDAELSSDSDYELEVDIDPAEAERYEPPPIEGLGTQPLRRESLTFTWLVDAGSTERIRGTFREGVESLKSASHTTWTTPSKAERARVFAVVRDDRGGIDFESLTLEVSP